ncbi:aspartate aminotransferase family protein [Methylotetracoccus oryzae]|uniref:aspartate aminotransferase family protein n=1 Tax=Methylotetracoccus oryzae TaxID=1919059 RepID=UPI00111B531B|nr:aspartate aminotransferase family protein [Methylotetracoccus oryzae]
MPSQVMPTYARLPVMFERGEGAWLWDKQDRRYLDAISGIAVCNLGHAHPAVFAAVCEQAGKLVHTSNLYRIEKQEELAQELCRVSGMENVFFCNSGAEANEAALKIARRYGHFRGIDEPAVIVMEGAFHGRTLATLSATGNRKVQEGFAPLMSGFVRVPYDDIAAVEAVADPNVVAILVEPIQGEGGIRVPADDFLLQLRRICDQREWLLMLDEIQTGIGRTGKFLAYQHTFVRPDVISVAKALGNGVPIGACLASGVASEMLTAGKHGSTFGGNALACSAALAVLKALSRDQLIERAARLGDQIRETLRTALGQHAHVVDVRGKGMMIGIELDQPCGELVSLALERGLLINVTADRVVRLLPPLVFTEEQARLLADELSKLIVGYLKLTA